METGIWATYRTSFFTVFLLVSVSALSGCSGGGGDPLNTRTPGEGTPQGVFVDSPVEGLHFLSATQSGTTDSNGAFLYQEGETVSFYVGDILLGSTLGAETVTPLDLVSGAVDDTDPQVTNILRFLQGLDDDGNPGNGIRISEGFRSALVGQSLDFSTDTLSFESAFNTLAASVLGGRTLVSTSQARMHFRRTQDVLAGGAGFGRLAITIPVVGYREEFVPRLIIGFGNWLENEQGTGIQVAITSRGTPDQVYDVTVMGPYGFYIRCYPVEDPLCSSISVDVEMGEVRFNSLTRQMESGGNTYEVVYDGVLYWG